MLTVKEAARVGINACIDKLGCDFVLANRDNGTSAYGENDSLVFCFVGVDDKPWELESSDTLVLDSTTQFPYCAKGLPGPVELLRNVSEGKIKVEYVKTKYK